MYSVLLYLKSNARSMLSNLVTGLVSDLLRMYVLTSRGIEIDLLTYSLVGYHYWSDVHSCWTC